MEHNKKNKLLTWLVLLLLIANVGSIALFWLDKEKQPARQQQRETPAEFLIRTLQLDTKQQAQLEVLRAEHQAAAVALREQLQQAKQSLFALIKQPAVTDSMKLSATRTVSLITEKIDLLTLNHFIKVRSMCNGTQQKKFDKIIQQVTVMISNAGEPPPADNDRPPPPNHQDDRPPPPSNN